MSGWGVLTVQVHSASASTREDEHTCQAIYRPQPMGLSEWMGVLTVQRSTRVLLSGRAGRAGRWAMGDGRAHTAFAVRTR